MENSERLIDILLVEDNLGDLRLLEEALEDSKLHLNLSIARDGQEALDFLTKQGDYANSPRPDLVLLDWNLPRVKGEEVLSTIKNSKNLRHIPVVVLTSSQAQEDVLRSYDLHANCFITKPIDFDKFSKIVDAIGGFWFSIVHLPPKVAEA